MKIVTVPAGTTAYLTKTDGFDYAAKCAEMNAEAEKLDIKTRYEVTDS